jgi:hypothetical protein
VSDERFDDAIRDALLADDPGPVPVRLRARMATIPGEAGQRAAGGWRQRLIAVAVPAAVLAGVAVVAVVFGAIALRGEPTASVVPTVAPSVVASAQPATSQSAAPSPSSSATAATPVPTGPITILPSQVTALTPGVFAIHDLDWYGEIPSGKGSDPTFFATGPSGGSTLLELRNGHDISSYALTDAGIAWVETWYTDKAINCGNNVPCSPHMGQPVSWAVNLTTFAGTTTRLDTGVVSRTSVEGEGAGPLPPVMAAQGSRVAYAVPRLNVPGAPEASRIVIRSLPDGALVRTIDTDGYVAQISLFGQAVAFLDALDTAGGASVDPGNATLHVTASDPQTPTALGTHVADAVIGDGGSPGTLRVAWATNDMNSGSIRVADLGVGATVVLAASSGTDGPASQLNLIGNGVVWIVQSPDASGVDASLVNAWQPGWDAGREVPSLGSPDTLGVTDSRLLVTGGNVAQLGGSPAGAIPASALFGSMP